MSYDYNPCNSVLLFLCFLVSHIPGVEFGTFTNHRRSFPDQRWLRSWCVRGLKRCSKRNRDGGDTEKGNLYSAVVGRAVPFVRTALRGANGDEYAL